LTILKAVGGPTLDSLQTPTLTSQNSFPDEEFDEETLEAEDRVSSQSER